MNEFRNPALLALVIVSALSGLLTGCGGASRDNVVGNTPGYQYPGPYPSFPPSGCPGLPGCPPTTGGGTDPMQDPNFTPTVSASFALQGYSGTASQTVLPAVNTDSILKLRLIAGPAEPVTGTNFVPQYQCMDFLVTVSGLGASVRTKLITVNSAGGPCPGANQGQFIQGWHGDILDFSSRLSPGHGPLTITVSQARTTYLCEWWYRGYVYGPYSGVCPAGTLYSNHKVTGTIEVMTNGP